MATDHDNAGNDTSSTIRDTVGRAAQSAHEAIDSVASKAAPAIEQMQSAASNAAQSLEENASALGELEEVWLESARSCVRDHPIAAVLLALAAGMLISKLSN